MLQIAFLGDSITAGCGASCPENAYVSLVEKRLQCKTYNFGVGGSRIARQRIPTEDQPWADEDFMMRCEKMPDDLDLVFVFGGTNDYGHGDAVIGDPESTDPYTFCGALNLLVARLIERYGKDKICFILPLHRMGEDNPYGDPNRRTFATLPLPGYIEIIREKMEKEKIDYLDLSDEFGIPQMFENEILADGLHPNDKGYRIITDRVCEYITAHTNAAK